MNLKTENRNPNHAHTKSYSYLCYILLYIFTFNNIVNNRLNVTDKRSANNWPGLYLLNDMP